MYYIKRLPDGFIGGLPFNSLSDAKKEAEKLCNGQAREVHYEVLEVKPVWVTSTLDEAMKEPQKTLADRPKVPPNFKE